MKPYENGRAFELYVADLYRDIGRREVAHDVHITIAKGVRVQIDIMYQGWFRKQYIECKYTSNTAIALDDIAKFSAQLTLLQASPKQGTIITNATFDARVCMYAKQIGLQLIDSTGLEHLEKKRVPFFKRFVNKQCTIAPLEKVLRNYAQKG